MTCRFKGGGNGCEPMDLGTQSVAGGPEDETNVMVVPKT
jgi:hypothetical protein